MTALNDDGPRVRTAGPSANRTISAADYRAPGPDGKDVATLIARLAIAGHVVHNGSTGDFTVCRYGMSRHCSNFGELQSFAKIVGATR